MTTWWWTTGFHASGVLWNAGAGSSGPTKNSSVFAKLWNPVKALP